jgi:hypothetical protein
MPQADQSVANASFPAVRTDINLNFAALFSNNSGDSAPTVTAAHMDWIQITGASTATWYKRNSGNNAWITVATISGSTISFEGTLPAQASQSGKFLTTNGTVASWAAITAGGRLLRAPQTLTSGTSYTAPANCNAIYVEAVGGGGGGAGTVGAGGGGGGGAGGYCAKYFAVVPAVTYTYTIGAGGTAGTAGGAGVSGGTGGSTTFTVGATTITSGGGGGGASESSGGAGGACTNGDINISGGGGGAGGGAPPSGNGGNSFFGGGGAGQSALTAGIAGIAGIAGSGGSGGASTGANAAGGAGGAGLIRIWEYS